MSRSPINNMPTRWASLPLEEAAVHVLGGAWGHPPDATDADLVDVQVIRGTEFRLWQQTGFSTAAARRLERKSLTRRQLVQGDLVLEISGGGPTQPVGRVIRIPELTLKSLPLVCSNFCRQVRLTPLIDPAFAESWLTLLYQCGWMDAFQSNTTNIRNLSFPRFASETPLVVAPLNEQRRIVAKLDACMEHSKNAKEALDAIPPLLEQFRQSVLAAAFRGDLTKDWREKNKDVEPASELLKRIRIERRKKWEEDYIEKQRAKGKEPKGDKWKAKYKEPEPVEDLGGLPPSWCWTSVAAIGPLQAGYAFSSKSFRKSGVRLLKGNNVRDGWLADDQINHLDPADAARFDSYRLNAGDVVLAMDRPVYSSGSRATKVAQLDEAWAHSLLLQRVGCFRAGDYIDRRFLFWFVSGASFRDHIIGRQTGTQDGKDLPHVSARTVDLAAVPLPPLAEQEAIGAIVDRLLGAAAASQQQVDFAHERMVALDAGVLGKAFRGELVPQDPSDEPASALLERIRAERAAEDRPRRNKKSASKKRVAGAKADG